MISNERMAEIEQKHAKCDSSLECSELLTALRKTRDKAENYQGSLIVVEEMYDDMKKERDALQAVVRELVDLLMATRARWNLEIPGYEQALAHPLVAAARK